MKKSKDRLWIMLGLGAMLLVGPLACAPRVIVNAIVPPQFSLPNVRRVAVVPFSPRRWGGKEGLILSDLIASNLSSSEARRLFTVIEGNALPPAMREQSTRRVFAADELTGMTRQTKTQAVIVGRVTSYYVSRRRWRKREVYYREGVKYVRRVRCLTRIGNVGATIRVVQAGTGAVLHSITRMKSYRSTGCGLARGRVMGRHALLENATNNLAHSLVKPLIPEVQRLSIVIETGGKDKRLNLGVKLAKKERWERAEELWREVLRSNPRSHRALYNLGVATEVRGALTDARLLYRRAERLIPKNLYIQAMNRIDARLQNRNEMRRLQRKARPKPQVSPADDPTAG